MAGMMDRILGAMKLNPDYDEYDEYDESEDYEEYQAAVPDDKGFRFRPSKKASSSKKSRYYDEEEDYEAPKKNSSKITPIRQSKSKASSADQEVCIIRPTDVKDAQEITDTLLMNKTVLLNLEGLELDTAQRLIDFASGSCYALHGKFEIISNSIFVIAPASVNVSGDSQGTLGGSVNVL